VDSRDDAPAHTAHGPGDDYAAPIPRPMPAR
jgi:hypothetical protein